MHKWGLAGLLAAALEQGGAFSFMAAQSLYVATPILETWIPKTSLSALAEKMEDPAGCAELATKLREEK